MSQPIFTYPHVGPDGHGHRTEHGAGQLAEPAEAADLSDLLGTMLVAVLCGPWIGGLTRLVTNLLLGSQGPTPPFRPVAAIIGVAASRWRVRACSARPGARRLPAR